MNDILPYYDYIQFPDFIKKTPLTCDYAELSVKEAKAYNAWFHDIMPQRINYMLSRCSAETGVPVEELWIFPDGFFPIWKWFRTRQKLRKTTQEEQDEMRQQYGFLGESWVLQEILDDATERLHHDIGMFLGYQFVRHYPNDLEWSLIMRPQSYVHCRAPVIIGFSKYIKNGKVGSDAMEPVHVVGGESRGIFHNKMTDDGLIKLARGLMEAIYDVDTRKPVPPLDL